MIYLTWLRLRLTCFYNLKFIDTATLPYELPYELPNIQQIKNDNENKKQKNLGTGYLGKLWPTVD